MTTMTCPNCGTSTATSPCPSCGTAVAPYAGAPLTTAVAEPAEMRNWAMGCHIAALAGYVVPFGNIIGPLICWLSKRSESALVDRNGKEALNFQISMSLYAIVSAVLIFALIGIPLLFAVGILDLVCTIIAAVKTSNGQPYRYPLTIRFLR
jgi:uncharacterized protein